LQKVCYHFRLFHRSKSRKLARRRGSTVNPESFNEVATPNTHQPTTQPVDCLFDADNGDLCMIGWSVISKWVHNLFLFLFFFKLCVLSYFCSQLFLSFPVVYCNIPVCTASEGNRERGIIIIILRIY
jgi:hypothetical protein